MSRFPSVGLPSNFDFGHEIWFSRGKKSIFLSVSVFMCISFHIIFLHAYGLIDLAFCYAEFKFCSSGKKKNITVPVTIGVVAVCIAVLILGVLWWKGCLPGKKRKEKGKALLRFSLKEKYQSFKICQLVVLLTNTSSTLQLKAF